MKPNIRETQMADLLRTVLDEALVGGTLLPPTVRHLAEQMAVLGLITATAMPCDDCRDEWPEAMITKCPVTGACLCPDCSLMGEGDRRRDDLDDACDRAEDEYADPLPFLGIDPFADA